jgi:hypothetical protein
MIAQLGSKTRPLMSPRRRAPVRSEPIRNGHLRLALCEGVCSAGMYSSESWILHMRAAGYSPDQVRAHLSSKMSSTWHRDVRRDVNEGAGEAAVFARCTVCGHERQIGLEEWP